MYISKLTALCQQADTLQDLKEVFLRYITQFGSDYFTQFTLGEGGEMKASSPFGCFEHPWPAHYVRRGFLRQDAALVKAFRSTRPILWSEGYLQSPNKAAVILEEAVAFGLKEGLVIPIRSPMGDVTIFTIAGGDEFDPSWEERAIMQMGAQIAFERSCDLHPGWETENNLLTPAQNRVLQLLAEGLSAGATADILRIAEGTVKDHKKAIFKALGVSAIGNAVFEAYRRGLIDTPL